MTELRLLMSTSKSAGIGDLFHNFLAAPLFLCFFVIWSLIFLVEDKERQVAEGAHSSEPQKKYQPVSSVYSPKVLNALN